MNKSRFFHFDIVLQQRHAADLSSMYAHNAYQDAHNHNDHIATHFTQAQYHPNIHHHTVHKVPNIQLRSLELLADKNSLLQLTEHLNEISHPHSV